MSLRCAGRGIYLSGMLRWIREEWEMATFSMKAIVLAGCLLIVALCAVLVWTLRNWRGAPHEAPEPAVAQAPEPDIDFETVLAETDVLPSLGPNERTILEKHFSALGGVRRLASISSMLSKGEVTLADGTVREIVVVKKEGSRMRMSVRTPAGQVVMAITPEDSWRCVWRGGRLVSLEDLSREDAQRMKRSSYVVSELYLAMHNPWTVEYLGAQAFNYRMAHCFEVEINDRERLRFFIDPDSFLDVGREEWVFDEDGTLTITRLVGSEHMDIAGLKVPGKIETYENNVLMQTFVARDVEINLGVFNKTFERPEPVLTDDAATPSPSGAEPGQ